MLGGPNYGGQPTPRVGLVVLAEIPKGRVFSSDHEQALTSDYCHRRLKELLLTSEHAGFTLRRYAINPPLSPSVLCAPVRQPSTGPSTCFRDYASTKLCQVRRGSVGSHKGRFR